ncbi:MAG TPA: PBSX family phage terminase large subunit [Candidatus Avimonoglobus intestinipullorum]|uniref:PBSX family phage terminase large subunit n=1 Tax=Candidatus Avimonoglobus intestinipullorum TaxID=2840699 RepID=A0A9D1S6Q4_9FIRM|nr:PBSX family phage terminase large subunit [Candidatus Avimonoglobus intestinipullorum]
MRIKTLSEKQRQIFRFAQSADYALICDGAVRSGKTVAMLAAFMLWAMGNFNNTNFALCGKTVQATERNLLNPLRQIQGLPYRYKYKISTKTLTVTCGGVENVFYLFGGKDESSYALIQGLTLAGVLFDEVALMPRSFVEQAIARTLSYAEAKLWFNCNPDSPTHWFYQEWIQTPRTGVRHIHFLMRDNPILTEKEIEKAAMMFSGVFYDKYIKGLWVRAEGIVFPDFANNPEKYIVQASEVPKRFRWVDCGFDIGGNNSAYAMTCSAMGYDGVLYVLAAKKRQAQDLPMEEVEQYAFGFIDDTEAKYGVRIHNVNTDHSDVIINTLNEKRYIFGKTYKPPLEDRPFQISRLMALGRLKLAGDACGALIDELSNVVFDDKNEKPVILDDGSMQIDTVDSFVYSLAGNWNYLDD